MKALTARSAKPGGDGAGLGVAVQHGVDDVVDGAGADGVVRRVAHHLAPGQSRSAAGYAAGGWKSAASGSARRSSSRSAAAPARLTSTRLEVTPISMLERKPERSSPCTARAPPWSRARQVPGSGGHLEVEVVLQVVGLGHDAAQLWLGHQVVGAVHDQHVVDQEVRHLVDVVLGAPHERLGVVGERGPVAVPDRQVLGPHARAVRCLPVEGVLRDLRRHAAPDHRVAEASPSAGSAASGRCARTCRAGIPRPSSRRRRRRAARPICRFRTMVSPEERNSSIRMYHGPHADPARRRQRAEPLLVVRAAPRGSRRPPPSARRA